MSLRVPDWWQFVLLALAAYRIYRLGARDTITEPIRAAVTYADDEAVTLDAEPHIEVVGSLPPARDPGKASGGTVFPKTWRIYLSTLIRCPWCAGFYVAVAVWGAWVILPRWTLFLAVPLALSCVLGFAKKNLDG